MELKKLVNCICKVKIDGKMSLVSLYDDLPHFELDQTIDNLKNSKKKLQTLIQELKQCVQKLENENSQIKTSNVILCKNITSLYKTANSEIRRKDKIIDELRKSLVHGLPTSKMFPSRPLSSNSNLKEIQFNKLSKENQDSEQVNNIADKSKTSIQCNDIRNISIQPNNDIPKTVYYKRLCQKLIQQNVTIELSNKVPKHIEKYNQDDKIIINTKNEKFNNDNNIINESEIVAPLVHNASEEYLNSTLVICESDVTPSDGELDTTPVIQCERPQKDKENVSSDSLFSKLKQSTKKKKKIIITPATIGVQNVLKTSKCAEKLNRSTNLNSDNIKCKVSDSLDNKINNCDINTQSIFIEDHDKMNDSKTDNRTLQTTDVIYNEKLPSTTKNNQIPTTNIEMEHVPTKKKTVVIKNNDISVSTKVRKSHVTCSNSSNNHSSNMSMKSVKCLSTSNEKLSTSLPEETNDQSENKLPTIIDVSNLEECTRSVDSVQNSAIENNCAISKCTSVPSISIEVEQVPTKRKIGISQKDNVNPVPIKVRKSRVTCLSSSNNHSSNMLIKNVKCLSTSNEKLSTSLPEETNDQSENKLPTIIDVSNLEECTRSVDSVQNSAIENNCAISTCTSVPSISIEVEQVPTKRKIGISQKDNVNPVPIKVRKSRVTCLSSSNNHSSNMLIKNVKCLSMSNERPSTSLSKETNDQLENKLPTIIDVSNLEECTRSVDPVQNSAIENNCAINTFTSMPSISIEVEQVPTKRKIGISQKDNVNPVPIKVRKSRVTCLSSSNEYESNMMIENVKCLPMNNEKQSFSPYKQNDKSKCKLPVINHIDEVKGPVQSVDSVKNASKTTAIEKNVADKISIPSISIDVEQGSIFKHSSTRKVIIRSSSENKQEVKKGRRVQLITIKDRYSQPLPSFNGAKKTEIDVSKNSVHIEKVVESSSRFYVPQVKRRSTMNFGNADL